MWQDCEGLAGATRRMRRKEREEEWRKEEGERERGKLMNGRYYMEGKMREEQVNEGGRWDWGAFLMGSIQLRLDYRGELGAF